MSKVTFQCKKCKWRYDGDMEHLYIVLKHYKEHGEQLMVTLDWTIPMLHRHWNDWWNHHGRNILLPGLYWKTGKI